MSKICPTPFGRACRKIRVDMGIRMKTQAYHLDTTQAYISAVELGKKPASEDYLEKLFEYYKLDDKQKQELIHLASISITHLKVNLAKRNHEEREIIVGILSGISNLTSDQKRTIRGVLGNVQQRRVNQRF